MAQARTRGFTLVELMITIAVVAILSLIAWPNFRDFMHRNTATSQANQVLASLQYARNEAVSRRYPTALCGSTDGTGCSSGDTNLANGWLAWRSNTPQFAASPPKYVAGTDELLRVTQAQNNVVIVSFGPTADQIAFDQTGAVVGADGVASNIVVCAKDKPGDTVGINTQSVPGKYVRVDPSGRITVQNLASTDTCDKTPGS